MCYTQAIVLLSLLYSCTSLCCIVYIHFLLVLLDMCFLCYFKGYAVSAILKIFAFEIAVGRKSDMLPEVNENMCLFL